MQSNLTFLLKTRLTLRVAALVLMLAVGLAVVLPATPATAGVAVGAQGGACDTTLNILYITDLHGALLSEDKDFATGKSVGGAAVVAGYIEAARESLRGPVLLVASGDMMQGSAVSNLSRGEAVITFMNKLGFEACAVGNHEFDWGISVLRERMKQAKFPFLVANMFSISGSKRPDWAIPYTVVQKGPLKIGIIGVITADASVVINPKSIKGLKFAPSDSIVNVIAARLRKEGANVIVVLAHEGGTQEKDGRITGPIADLTAKFKGVDVVLAGHSHTVVSGAVNSIPVVIAGANGVRLGVVRLRVDACRGGSSLLEESVRPTFVDGVKPDTAVVSIVESFQKKFAVELERTVAIASEPIMRSGKESALGDLISDIVREAAGADIAYQNSGSIRVDLNKGPITGGNLYRLMPFDNTIVTMYLTGAQVKQVLEQGTTDRGLVQVSGIHYTYKPENAPGRRIQSVTLGDGKPISPTKLYLVATNDFMANGGERYTIFKEGKKIRNTQIVVRDAIFSWMEARQKAGKEIVPPALGRAEIVQ